MPTEKPTQDGMWETDTSPCSHSDKESTWNTEYKKLTCTAANTTAPLQSQDWYLIICVTSTFCFQMSFTFVKNVQKQKAALRMTHLAPCRFVEGEICQKTWYFHVRSVKNIFPVLSSSPSNWRRTFLHILHVLQLVIRTIHSYEWTRLPPSKDST